MSYRFHARHNSVGGSGGAKTPGKAGWLGGGASLLNEGDGVGQVKLMGFGGRCHLGGWSRLG